MSNEEHLKLFLEEYGAIECFILGLENNDDDYYMGVDGDAVVEEALLMCFCWESHEPGHTDWEDLHVKWEEYVSQNGLVDVVCMKTFMEVCTPKLLTNEEILKMFLKKKRKLMAYRELTRNKETLCGVAFAFNSAFSWPETLEGRQFWTDVNSEWQELCSKFKLTGNIKCKDV